MRELICNMIDRCDHNKYGRCDYPSDKNLSLQEVISNTGEPLFRCVGYRHKKCKADQSYNQNLPRQRVTRTLNIPEIMSVDEIPIFMNNLDED